jgi:hypothetical protein
VFTAPIIIKSPGSPGPPEIPAARKQEGGATFIDCSSVGSGRAGFFFRGSGHHVMYNTRSTNDPIAFDIGDDVEVEDYNTIIE